MAKEPASSAVTAAASFPSAFATRSQTELKKAPWHVHRIPAPIPPTRDPKSMVGSCAPVPLMHEPFFAVSAHMFAAVANRPTYTAYNAIDRERPFFAPRMLKASVEKNRLQTNVAPYNMALPAWPVSLVSTEEAYRMGVVTVAWLIANVQLMTANSLRQSRDSSASGFSSSPNRGVGGPWLNEPIALPVSRCDAIAMLSNQNST
mmetsp:Transcript_4070/g.7412  ORF Transcript_4070/g.7412 Transcript_4070/m.7412 type:complete len:204 (-) Transcript_4070:14-625(-)